MKSIQCNKNVKGFSLLEILLVLGVAAGLIVAAFVVYPKVQASNRANAESVNITTIAAGVKALFGSQSSFIGLSNTVVNGGNIAPTTMQVSGVPASLVNSWGGVVTVAPTSFTRTNGEFSITYTKVPKVECTKLATSLGANFQRVTVQATQLKNIFPVGAQVPEVNVATATTACVDAGSTMVFVQN